MTASAEQQLHTLCTNENACVTYLFGKRWPWGFTCPFCGSVQKEIAPAYTVVCRYCRKQTSITAHTLMHGSKKDLVAWMKVAWQFCFHNQGISARELQGLMGLSCYQTAWIWLQKLRRAAALTESARCCGVVHFEVSPLSASLSSEKDSPDIGIALEFERRREKRGRVKFFVLASRSPHLITSAIHQLIDRNTTLLMAEAESPCRECAIEHYLYRQPTPEQLERSRHLFRETELWLTAVYRGAIDSSHLQSYLDEFSFHYNTRYWPERLDVFDHRRSR